MAATDGDLRVGVRWSKEEDKKLREKLAIHMDQTEEGSGLFKTDIDWEDVSKYVGGRRNAIMCQNRWSMMTIQPGKGLAWTDAEDAGTCTTLCAMTIFVINTTPSRHLTLLPITSYHPHPILSCYLTLSPYPPPYPTPALKDMVTKEGMTKRSEIATRLGTGRVGKQCRERWYNHLDPTLKKSTPWTVEEEGLLFSQQQKIGNQWKEISHMIPGRSENDCKNKFNTTMR